MRVWLQQRLLQPHLLQPSPLPLGARLHLQGQGLLNGGRGAWQAWVQVWVQAQAWVELWLWMCRL